MGARPRTLRRDRELGPARGKQRFTDTEIQRIIELRVEQRKPLREIATQLNRTYRSISGVWLSRCSKLLSKEALHSVYACSMNQWTIEEVDHLIELHNQGQLTCRHMALHFPSRTLWAVEAKLNAVVHSLGILGKEKTLSTLHKTTLSSKPNQSQRRRVSPTRPTLSPSGNVGSTLRRAFSSSSRDTFREKPHSWTEEEDQKLLELERRGLRFASIAANFDHRPRLKNNWDRLAVLRDNKPSNGTLWTAEEDAILIQKREEGLRFVEIARHLPGRSHRAVYKRWFMNQRPDVRTSGPSKRQSWTHSEMQQIIEMKLKQHMSYGDIATHFGCSPTAACLVWHRRAVKLLPENLRHDLWYQDHWTPEETKRIIHLKNQYFGSKNIALQFPSKTLIAIRSQLQQLHSQSVVSVRTFSTHSKRDHAALKKALEPYLGKKLPDLTDIHEAFPAFSKKQVYDALQ